MSTITKGQMWVDNYTQLVMCRMLVNTFATSVSLYQDSGEVYAYTCHRQRKRKGLMHRVEYEETEKFCRHEQEDSRWQHILFKKAG